MNDKIIGIVLAGGQAQRMGGGDKTLLPLNGGTLLDELVARLQPQVSGWALSANGNPERFARFGVTVLPDAGGVSEGPLSGILSGLRYACQKDAQAIATVAGDTPFIPHDLIAQLRASTKELTRLVVASSNERVHPTVALWPTSLYAQLAAYLESEPDRKMMRFLDQAGYETRNFSAVPVDPFFNVNTPDDLATARWIADLHP